jgi:hypothetical protein
MTSYALNFFQTHIPFWEMQPDNALASAPYVLAKPGQVYAIYRPAGSPDASVQLNLGDDAGSYTVLWYNPRAGGPLMTGSITEVSGPGLVELGLPPEDSALDWVILVDRA